MRHLLLLAVLGISAAGPARGQGRQEHRGFWFGFGLGGGVNLSQGLDGARLGGGGGYIRLGGTVQQKVLLGGEVIGWTRNRNGDELDRGNVTFTAIYYPNETGGPFLKGGVGFATVGQSRTSGNTTSTTTKEGFGATIGVGLDLRIGRNLYLVPAVDWLFQAFSSETDPVLGKIPGTNTLLLFTLGLTWH